MPRGPVGQIRLTVTPDQRYDLEEAAKGFAMPLSDYLRGQLHFFLTSKGFFEVFPEREPEVLSWEDPAEAERKLRLDVLDSLRAGAEERRLEAYRLQRDMIR